MRENSTTEQFLKEINSKIEEITSNDRNIVDKASQKVNEVVKNVNQTHLI